VSIVWGKNDVTCVTSEPQCPITGSQTLLLPGPFLVRILLWLVIFIACPLSVTAAQLSFRLEVIGCTTYAALPAERCMTLAERTLARLEKAEAKEPDPWLRDDIRIAWITILEASRGNSQPHIDATYRVLGKHPDQVWPAILANREALLGRNFGLIGADAPPTFQRANNLVDELSPNKSTDIPQTKKQPMAESRDGNAPQKTCAYGAQESKLAGQKRRDLTGASCSTETKREARRALTSEFGLNDAPPAGVAAPAAKQSEAA
jgi:hypothetical protein